MFNSYNAVTFVMMLHDVVLHLQTQRAEEISQVRLKALYNAPTSCASVARPASVLTLGWAYSTASQMRLACK